MKKIIACILALVMLCMMLTACSETGTCEMCGKEGKGKTITYQGEKGFYCNDCAKTVEALIDMMEGLGGLG